jgi:DEAD/DEAH box helicase domain-containing protein
VQEIVSFLQQLARQRAGGGAGPLVAARPLPATTGQRARHLPLLPVLAQAWMALTGEPPRPHQAAAVPMVRRGEPLALMADDPTVELTAQLLLYDTLLADPRARALYLLPDAEAIGARDRALTHLDQLVPGAPSRALLDEGTPLRGRLPQLLLTTPEVLHGHLLRHHDRAWRELWGRLGMVLLSDAHRYSGVAAAHIAALLLRTHRLCANANNVPRTLATLARVEQPQATLEALIGGVYRVQPADDGPRAATTLLLWRAGMDRLRSASQLVSSLHGAGFRVALAAAPVELPLLDQSLGDVATIGDGSTTLPGQALVLLGLPGGLTGLRRALAAGHEAVVVLLGETPHERLLAERPDLAIEATIEWTPPPSNAYVDAQHLLCAASELPLRDEEIEAWHVGELVERLAKQGRLSNLPGEEGSWQPRGDDPYAEFSVRGAGVGAALIRDVAGAPLDELDPAQFDRWAFVGAALPLAHGSLRVARRDEEALTALTRMETGGRRCLPLRRCTLTLREERAQITLNCGQPSGWARVLVDEQVYGFREQGPSGPSEQRLTPPLETRWTAGAWWIELPASTKNEGQLLGWCLASAVALCTASSFGDLVPCYEERSRRLYLVEAQPGGNGMGEWLFARAEELLPLAYDTALACRNDALLEPLARLDMDWLLPLLGRTRQSVPPAPAAVEDARGERAILLDLGPRREPRRNETTESRRRSGQPPVSDDDTLAGLLDTPPPQQLKPAPPQPELPTPELSQPEPPQPEPSWPEPPATRRASPPFSQPQMPQPEPPQPERYGSPASQPTPVEPDQDEEQHDFLDVSWEPDPPRQTPERYRQPPPPPRQATPEPEDAPNADAMIARMRRMREQRAAAQQRGQPRANSGARPTASSDAPPEPRFATGDRIFCLPFGDGVVRASRIVGDKELLQVAFADHGEITIDPAVSLVRRLESSEPEEAGED